MRIGLDCANGSAWNIAKAVFDALGAKTYVINAEPNGTNINNNAGFHPYRGSPEACSGEGTGCWLCLRRRCGPLTLCGGEGKCGQRGCDPLWCTGSYMKERGKLLTNTVVTTVMSNFGLYQGF